MSSSITSVSCSNLRVPGIDEYNAYYGNYIKLVPEGDIALLAANQIEELSQLLGRLTGPFASELHAPYTWTIKQVCGHMIDTERIFADRAHRFSAAEPQSLPGFDQDVYVANQDFATPMLRSLLDELLHCRRANVLFMQRIPSGVWDRRGVASDNPITVRALAYCLVGHVSHHAKIIRKRIESSRVD
jgi:DinB superfamily